jgi:ubiquinone/menaquinone biosynthesis C-methylase UbiE
VEYGDIVRGLPVSEDSCAAAYCSHVLEHLALEDCRKALANTYRFLRPGGIFRFVMPDLKALARTYLDDSTSDASIRFMQRSYLGREVRARNVGDFLRSWLGNSEHLWMWDFDSMQAELERVGFRDIRPALYGDSADPRFDDVEDKNRWFQPGLDGRQVPCLGIECRK